MKKRRAWVAGTLCSRAEREGTHPAGAPRRLSVQDSTQSEMSGELEGCGFTDDPIMCKSQNDGKGKFVLRPWGGCFMAPL